MAFAMRSSFAARVSGARPAVRGARPASRMSCMAYKVTLKTPSGDKTIECPADTYILDAAEVRMPESWGHVRVGVSSRRGHMQHCMRLQLDVIYRLRDISGHACAYVAQDKVLDH